MDERSAVLRGIRVFEGLDDEALSAVAANAGPADLAAGSVLTHEGRHEGYLYIVVSGSLRIERGGRVVDTAGPGDVLGEIALRDAGPRTATVTALTDCRLLRIGNDRVEQLAASHPSLREALDKEAERHLQRIDDEGGA